MILNRDGIGNSDVVDFCEQAGIPILMRIPMDRRLAEALARGKTLVAVQPQYKTSFQELYNQIRDPGVGWQGGCKVKQLVILSGKGGTGKTSVTAAFAHLATEGPCPFQNRLGRCGCGCCQP